MRKIIITWVLLLCGLLCLYQRSQADDLPLLGVGTKQVISGGGGYTGPLDCSGCATTALGFWALRAPTAAYATAQGVLANICTPSDATCADVKSDTSGNFNLSGTPSLTCNNSTSICTVKIIYDTSGGHVTGNCTVSLTPCDLTNATIADRPVLVVPGAANGCSTTSHYCMDFHGVSTAGLQSGGHVQAFSQPFSVTDVVVLATTSAGDIISNSGNTYFITTDSTPNFNNFAGSNLTKSISTNQWYSEQSVLNGASSSIDANGSSTSGAAGAGTGGNNDGWNMGWDSFNGVFQGKISEVGFYGIGLSGTQQSNLTSNQRTYWGF